MCSSCGHAIGYDAEYARAMERMRALGIELRAASCRDAVALRDIYAPYVLNTAVTFEYNVPSAEEFARRIAGTLERFPYIVAERDGEALGYAYAGSLHTRAAYAWAAETSIYLRRDLRRMGLGTALYAELERALRAQGILNLNACIACPRCEDQYLTMDSVRFHGRMGYSMVGKFHSCGYKFGRWYDMVWMEKLLGAHECPPPPVRTFEQVRMELRL